MAGKRKGLLLRAVAVVSGLLLLLAAAVWVVLRTSLSDRLIEKIAPEFLDADVSFSRCRVSLVKHWPDLTLEVDSLAITYPHELYGSHVLMPLQADGRGSRADTLLSCRTLIARAARKPLLKGRFIVKSLDADRLRLFAHNYGDTLASWRVFRSSGGGTGGVPHVELDRLHFTESFAAVSSAHGAWCLRGPVDLELSGAVDQDSTRLLLDVSKLKAVVDSIPLSIHGRMEFWGDSTVLDARANLKNAPLDKLLPGFVHPFVPSLRELVSDGRITLEAESQGAFRHGLLPLMRAKVNIPDCHVSFAPLRVAGTLGLRGDASSDSHLVIDADVDKLTARIPGLSLKADGRLDKLRGGDPHYRIKLDADAALDVLSHSIFKGSGISAEGDVALNLDVDALHSQLDRYKFRDASIKGQLGGERLSIRTDSLNILAFNPLLRVSSGAEGIAAGLDMDSTFVSGSLLLARLRGSSTLARVHKVEQRGASVPRIDIVSNNERLFLKSSDTRAGVGGAKIVASAVKRAPRDTAAFRARLRSDTTLVQRRLDYIRRDSARAFKERDIRINLDSTLTAYLKEWIPTVGVRLGRGFVASPALPLRTRLGGFSGEYDGRDFRLDSLQLRCGTSDLSASGSIKGVMRMFSQRRSFINARLKLNSARLNVNELLTAIDYGGKLRVEAETAEDDESFVLDSIPDAKAIHTSDLIVVPGNVDAALDMSVGRLDYQDFKLIPFNAKASVRDNTLQILDMYSDAGIARIGMNAFYATKSRNDISAGVNLDLGDIKAEDVIALMPFVDDLIPALKSFKGRLDCKLSATAGFDDKMNLLTPSLQGVLDIGGRDLFIEDAGELRRITRMLLFKNKNIGKIDDMSVSAVIKDNQAVIYPFQLGVDRYTLALQGVQGFDKSMDYHISVLKSPFLIPFGIYIRGRLDDWNFGFCLPRYRSGKLPVYTRQLDSVNFNLAKSIANIYSLGVEGVKKYNERAMAELEPEKLGLRKTASADEPLPGSDYKQLDAMLLEDEIAAQEAELRDSIEALLSDF
ncbi:MAG: hypothetical protein IJU68_02750 [Bacteroidales bacterium]|nr:hypothetical protein [Bacteroidales bacterium]